jgi:hypothetical protein
MERPVDNNDALANLKPLIAPEPISWWPLAPGWWLVGAALLLTAISLLVWGWKRWKHHRNTRYQREALQLLETVDSVADIALIIRRVAISVLGRSRAATAAWHAICPSMDEKSLQLLAESQYKNHSSIAVDAIEHLRQQTKLWIQYLPAVKH